VLAAKKCESERARKIKREMEKREKKSNTYANMGGGGAQLPLSLIHILVEEPFK